MAYPVEFSVVVPILKKILKEKGVTYGNLARMLNMSEANIKKIMVAKDCSLKRLNQICEALGLSLFDLIDMLRKRPVRQVLLSPEQQALLTRDELNLLLYFKVAFENVSPDQAKKELKLTDPMFSKKLAKLEAAGLLKKTNDGRITAPEEHFGLWPDVGPLSNLVKNEWTLSVLKAAARGHQRTGQDLGLRYFRLTDKTIQELRTKMAELLNEFERASMIESKVMPNTKDVSCLYAVVPDSLTNIRQKAQ